MLKEIKYSKTFQKSLRIFKEFNLSVRIKLGLKKINQTNSKEEDHKPEVLINKKINILSNESHKDIALRIQKGLSVFHIQSDILLEEPEPGFNEEIHFVVGTQSFVNLPNDYILIQTEKLTPEIFKEKNYSDVLNHARSILEYSIENMSILQEHGLSYRKIFYLPIDDEQNLIAYYFNRFLLANGIISYKEFVEWSGEIKLTNNFVCLGLPETTVRASYFAKENNKRGIQVFDGLRYNIGWVGCGLSYKYILHLAKQHQLEYIIVCEDDVEFLENFDAKLITIEEYLKANLEKWDVFSGFIADVHREMAVTNIDIYKGMEFIYIDKLMSMVFNIYNKSFFDKLSDWDSANLNKNVNTIDRYIENIGELRIITTLPYIVGHKEDLDSSIWNNVQNTVYTDQINKSQEILKNKIGYYKMMKKIKSFF